MEQPIQEPIHKATFTEGRFTVNVFYFSNGLFSMHTHRFKPYFTFIRTHPDIVRSMASLFLKACDERDRIMKTQKGINHAPPGAQVKPAQNKEGINGRDGGPNNLSTPTVKPIRLRSERRKSA